ncbi:Enoyl-(Acyl carrier protein) reductase [Rhizoctonia solani]|uniref:Enoyl-(Acyl carrier protein) reductase n=1 Tax=Rhizoctonia solani TaxID=456999 RepID=A0A8H7IMM9_9AGAM|nr:Enoyl-(Acyl carrier protein) reductase [Rhizoctonia solani]
MSTQAPICVVAGVGNGSGMHWRGCRPRIRKKGYSVALIARNPEHLKSIADEMRANGSDIRVAVWNVAHNVRRPFLEITEQIVQDSVQTNIVAAFAFARESILAFKDLELNKHGKRGALIFTSATAAWRGNTTTSAFSAGKHGERALAQSLNKEFGPQNIHVSNVIIDGPILNGRLEKLTTDKSLLANEDLRLDPTSIAASYVYLAHQDRTAWTFELDLRPAHEKW